MARYRNPYTRPWMVQPPTSLAGAADSGEKFQIFAINCTGPSEIHDLNEPSLRNWRGQYRARARPRTQHNRIENESEL